MKGSKRFLAIVGLASGLWLITAVPIIVGYLQANGQRAYVARVPIVAADTTAYYSNIEQARQGRVLLSNQFTSEVQQPTLLHPVWLVTGWLGSLTHLTTPWAFQLVRWLAIVAFLALLERIVSSLVPRRSYQWLVLILITTASGLGWLWSPSLIGQEVDIKLFSPDLWVAESNTFLTIGHSALFIGSQAVMLLVFWVFWQWTARQRTSLPWWLGPVTALLFLVHPYDLVTVGGVLVAWMAACLFQNRLSRPQLWHLARHGLWWAACLLPVLAYYLFFVLPEPAMGGWLEQNIDTTSPWPLVLIGYGLLLPLAVVGWWSGRKQTSLVTFLLVWMLVGFLLIYLPSVPFQRRLMSGLHLPIALLAGAGLCVLVERVFHRRWRSVFIVSGVIMLTITNIFMLTTDIKGVVNPQQANYPVYITRDEEKGIDWLRQNTARDDVIYAEVWMGNTIPGQAGRTVVLGHGHQTLHLQLRLRDWAAFSTAALTDQARGDMLERLRVTWLFWRQADATKSSYRPNEDPRWERTYQNATVEIFKLKVLPAAEGAVRHIELTSESRGS